MIDGGPGAEPSGRLDAWLVTDERAELIAAIRRMAARKGLVPHARDFRKDDVFVECRPVVHTSHPTYGYRIHAEGRTVVWAPEFLVFPRWARGADLMFAEGAAWSHPILFAGRVGGHLDVHAIAGAARRAGIRRLVFAHLGRPTVRALSSGEHPPLGEVAADGQTFFVKRRRSTTVREGNAHRHRGSPSMTRVIGRRPRGP